MMSDGSVCIRSQRQSRNSALCPPGGCAMSISESSPVKRSAYHFCIWPRYLPFHPWPTISRGMSQRRFVGILAFVDAALRHLPGVCGVDVLRPIAAFADEHPAFGVDQHDADAG